MADVLPRSTSEVQRTFVERARALRPFYLYTALWGEKFRRYFLEYCLPTLLSPNNIPALLNQSKNKFLICTTPEDWEAVVRAPIVQMLKHYVQPVFLPIPEPASFHTGYQHLHMGLGHKLATEMAHRDGAYGILVVPDSLLSDGSIATLQRHAVEGTQVVLSAAVRFGEEPLFQHLTSMGIVGPDLGGDSKGKPISVTGRQLAKAAVKSFHTEALRYEWESANFAEVPCACWWRVTGEDGVVLHALNWNPLLCDFAAVAQHDTKTLETWTIDGDYVFRNFKDVAHIRVVQDSDELLQVSWAPMEAQRLGQASYLTQSLPVLGEWVKGATVRHRFLTPVSDPLKRSIFPLAVRWHSQDLNANWTRTERNALATLRRYIRDEEFGFHPMATKVLVGEQRVVDQQRKAAADLLHGASQWRLRMSASFVYRITGWLGTILQFIRVSRNLLQHKHRIIVMTARALRGDETARHRIKSRLGKFCDQLAGRPFTGT